MVISHGVTLENSVFYSDAEHSLKGAREGAIFRINKRRGTMVPIQVKTILYHQKGENRLPEIITREEKLWEK